VEFAEEEVDDEDDDGDARYRVVGETCATQWIRIRDSGGEGDRNGT